MVVAVCVGRWRGFCQVPVDGREVSRQGKRVRSNPGRLLEFFHQGKAGKVISPGRWQKFHVKVRFISGAAKTMTPVRWPAALLTLSR